MKTNLRYPLPLLAAAAALLALALAACGGGEENKVIVMLDWYPWSNHTGLFRAQDAGYFKEEGLDVKIEVPSDPAAVLSIVGSGKADLGISYQTDVLQARAESIPVVSIAALVQHPLNTIMTLKESGITRPKQLEGKKLGTPGIPSNDAFLETMMRTDGGDPKKVEKVDVGFDLVQSLISKNVDAVIGAYPVHEAILAELQGFPVNIIRVEQFGVPDFYELVLITNENMAKEKPETLKKFMRAAVRGYQDVAKDRKMAVDLLMKQEKAPDTDENTYRKVEERGIEMLVPLWTDGVPKFGWQDTARWSSYNEWMQKSGLLTTQVDASKAFTNDFLP